ncbi:sensor histidine kinase [Acetivibrio clariflavus]|uniref:Oxygen sensor histidine kinase NreB n=1 Tax=Acetivibrio clariflavus (strain DSM 19732 / NBRC 101661 / EBR45) TaxID=720554 RepID=G8LXS8_ACECE|nr:sensor histidine kinase [Acetivibrio clariflavus]AEV68831.1 histidine kinase [Acetivibrio clariflavus DSM 19732]
MTNHKVDIANLDRIVKKTIEAINNSKTELFEIAENARKECERLKRELEELKERAALLIDDVEFLESELKQVKRQLMIINKNYDKYTEEEAKQAYEKADSLRIELAIKREQEQYLIRRRNELEIRLKDSIRTAEKADRLISNIGISLSCLTGDLQQVTLQLEDLQQRQIMGLKIIKAQEEERQRVAREMHDGPAQLMSNIVLKAEICERLMDSDPVKAKEELRNLKSIVRDTLQDVRKIIYNLRPMSLDDLGLVPTLQRFILTFQEESNIAVNFKTKGVCEEIKPEISLTIFRIVQESVNNVRKHAEATKVSISLEFLERELRLKVADNGKGFNTEELKTRKDNVNSGFGLYSMRERVDLLNGKFEINSAIGRGTRLDITVPLIPHEEVSNG